MLIQTMTIGENQVRIALQGFIYTNEADELREILISLIEAGKTTLTLDFSKLEYINSDGIGVLVGIQKQTRATGGVVITGLSGMVKEQFALFRLNSIFEIR